MSLEARVRWVEGALSIGQASKHTVAIDRAASVGGTEAGLKGGELFLLGVGGCLTSTLVGAANARDVTIVSIETRVVGTEAANPNRLSRVDVAIDFAATQNGVPLNDDELDKLLLIAERGCLVSNTIREGTELVVTRGVASRESVAIAH